MVVEYGLPRHYFLFVLPKTWRLIISWCLWIAVTLSRLYRQRRRSGAISPLKDYENSKFLSSNGLAHFSVKELTRDHHPDRDDEKSRVESAGGYVYEWGGVARVNGQLAVSRAIGDLSFKRWGSQPQEFVHMVVPPSLQLSPFWPQGELKTWFFFLFISQNSYLDLVLKYNYFENWRWNYLFIFFLGYYQLWCYTYTWSDRLATSDHQW